LNEEERDEALYHINRFYVKVQPDLRLLEAIGIGGLARHKFIINENQVVEKQQYTNK
jgi:hypothetical protein